MKSVVRSSIIIAAALIAQSARAEPFYFYAFDDPQNETGALDFDRHGNIIGEYNKQLDPITKGYLRRRDGSFEELVNTLLGALDTMPMAMNDSGTIVGFSQMASGRVASWTYSLKTRSFSPVAVMPGMDVYAYDINEAGTIVGSYYSVVGTKGMRGFSQPPNGPMELIDFPAAGSTCVFSINDKGTIGGGFQSFPLTTCEGAYASRPFIFAQGVYTYIPVKRPDNELADGAEYPARTLGNNGDFASQCTLSYYAATCFYQASTMMTQEVIPTSTFSIKDGVMTGSTDVFGANRMGYISKKRDLVSRCTPSFCY